MDKKEFESAKVTIHDYLVGTMRRKGEELEREEDEKKQRKIKFILKFLRNELESIKQLCFEDLP